MHLARWEFHRDILAAMVDDVADDLHRSWIILGEGDGPVTSSAERLLSFSEMGPEEGCEWL
jgi:hypothetical protein